MKKTLQIAAIVLFVVPITLTMGARRAAAQGPAGNGAASAAQDSSHSLNPIKWVKKDSKNSADAPATRSDVEKKLTPRMQSHGLLPAGATLGDTCSSFVELYDCLAALHASHNLDVDLNCLRADDTGVHTGADISGCKVADGEKPQGLNRAIHQLKPEANAKQATKEAEQQAKDDLKSIGL